MRNKQGEILVVPSSAFEWRGGRGVSKVSDLMPVSESVPCANREHNSFYIVSARTGQRHRFDYVFDEDGYDGEFGVFRNNESNVTVTVWNY